MWELFIPLIINFHKSCELTKGIFYSNNPENCLNDYIYQNSVLYLVLESTFQRVKEAEKARQAEEAGIGNVRSGAASV